MRILQSQQNDISFWVVIVIFKDIFTRFDLREAPPSSRDIQIHSNFLYWNFAGWKKVNLWHFFSWRNKQGMKYVNNHSHTYLESLSYGFWLFISWVSIHRIENIHWKKMHINVQCIITYSFAIKIKIRQSKYASTHFESILKKKSSYIVQYTYIMI